MQSLAQCGFLTTQNCSDIMEMQMPPGRPKESLQVGTALAMGVKRVHIP